MQTHFLREKGRDEGQGFHGPQPLSPGLECQVRPMNRMPQSSVIIAGTALGETVWGGGQNYELQSQLIRVQILAMPFVSKFLTSLSPSSVKWGR